MHNNYFYVTSQSRGKFKLFSRLQLSLVLTSLASLGKRTTHNHNLLSQLVGKATALLVLTSLSVFGKFYLICSSHSRGNLEHLFKFTATLGKTYNSQIIFDSSWARLQPLSSWTSLALFGKFSPHLHLFLAAFFFSKRNSLLKLSRNSWQTHNAKRTHKFISHSSYSSLVLTSLSLFGKLYLICTSLAAFAKRNSLLKLSRSS